MIAHLVVPYETYDTGEGPGRRLEFRRWSREVEVENGYWSEAEIDGNKAIVRVRAPEWMIAMIAKQEGWPLIDDPATAWTKLRSKPDGQGGLSETKVKAKPLDQLAREVLTHQQHDRFRREVEEIIELARRDGYYRLKRGSWDEETMLLQALARKGFGLDRVSTGTFPTQSVFETFTGSNGTSPPSGWVNGINGSGAIEIQSNACETAEASNGYGNGYYNGADVGPDSECYCTISSYSGENDRVGVAVRLAGGVGTGSVDGYVAVLDTVLGGTDTVVINRIDNGSWTSLGADIFQDMAANEKLGIEVIGNTITAYRHNGSTWASLGTRSDSTYSAAGKMGLYTRSANGTMRMDDVGGGTVSAGGGGGGSDNTMMMLGA